MSVSVKGKTYKVKNGFLKLSGLGITSLSEVTWSGNFSTLRELWLSENYIADIRMLGHLTNLESLNLNNNAIVDVQGLDVIKNLPRLRYLSLDRNPIMVTYPYASSLQKWRDLLTTHTTRGSPEVREVVEKSPPPKLFFEDKLPYKQYLSEETLQGLMFGGANSLSISADGRYLAAVWDRLIQVKDLKSPNNELVLDLSHELDEDPHVIISPNARFILIYQLGPIQKLIDLRLGNFVANISTDDDLLSAPVMIGDDLLACEAKSEGWEDEEKIAIYDMETGRKIQELKDAENRFDMLAVSSNGKYVACACNCESEGFVGIWDPNISTPLHKFKGNIPPNKKDGFYVPSQVVFSPNGDFILGGFFTEEAGCINVWDVRSHQSVNQFSFPKLTNFIVTRDNCHIVCFNEGEGLKVVSLTTGEVLKSIKLAEKIDRVPSEEVLLEICDQIIVIRLNLNSIRIVDLFNGSEIGSLDGVRNFTSSRDGHYIAFSQDLGKPALVFELDHRKWSEIETEKKKKGIVHEQEEEQRLANMESKLTQKIPSLMVLLRKYVYTLLKNLQKDFSTTSSAILDTRIQRDLEEKFPKFFRLLDLQGIRLNAAEQKAIFKLMIKESLPIRNELLTLLKQHEVEDEERKKLDLQKKHAKEQDALNLELFGESDRTLLKETHVQSYKSVQDQIDELMKSFATWEEEKPDKKN